jgi:hypothetical protein
MTGHAPGRTAVSGRALLVELGTITAGVLIALSLDGVTGWFRDRALVREANANLASEIRDNKAELERVMGELPKSGEQLKRILAVIADLEAKRGTPPTGLTIGYNLAQLGESSRTTAAATGALGLMPYVEVKKYSSVYELQHEFNRLQQRLLELWIPVLDVTHVDFEKLTAAELQGWRKQILSVLSYLQVQASVAKSLDDAYADLLAGR